MRRCLASGLVILVIMSAMAATNATAYELNVNPKFPATAVAQLTCEFSMYNVYVNLKNQHGDKVSYTKEDLANMRETILRAQDKATKLLQERYSDEEIEAFGAELQVMLDNLDVTARNENWQIGKVAKQCTKQAVNIGNKYDRLSHLKMMGTTAASPSVQESPSEEKEVKEETAAVRVEPNPTFEEEGIENTTFEEANTRLMEMEAAKPAKERTKDDWNAMDAEAMKLLDSMSK